MKHRLDRIVTKTGDSGSTSIRPNNRISKNSPIIHFLGDLDELNSFLGNLKAEMFTQCKNNPEFKKIIDVIKKSKTIYLIREVRYPHSIIIILINKVYKKLRNG